MFKYLVLSLTLVSLVSAQEPAKIKIAVSGLIHRKEVKENFYFEQDISRSTKVDVKNSETSSYDRGTTDDKKTILGRVTSSEKKDNAYESKKDETSISKNERNYIKTFGEKIRIEYGQLNDISNKINEELMKLGFAVTPLSGKHNTKNMNDEFLDVKTRIQNGDFTGSDYVLFGTIDSYDQIDEQNNTLAYRKVIMGVQYQLIKLQHASGDQHEVTASFNVLASGSSSRLNAPLSWKPVPSIIKEELQKSLVDQVLNKLVEFQFIKSKVNTKIPVTKLVL